MKLDLRGDIKKIMEANHFSVDVVLFPNTEDERCIKGIYDQDYLAITASTVVELSGKESVLTVAQSDVTDVEQYSQLRIEGTLFKVQQPPQTDFSGETRLWIEKV